MKYWILFISVVLSYATSFSQVEGLDGRYIYKNVEISNLSDSRVSKFVESNKVMYLVTFGKLKKLQDLTLKIKIDFLNIDQRTYLNFGIRFIANPVYNHKEIITYTKDKSLQCFGKTQGTYSLGEYEIKIVLKPINDLSGNVSVFINEDLLAQKIVNFSDFTQFNDWALFIAKLNSTPSIKEFSLFTKKEEFEKNKRGRIIKQENEVRKIEKEYPEGVEIDKIIDNRDRQTYDIVKIGHQWWMADNLNYKAINGSWCYGHNYEKCHIYGRLYNWKSARHACPDGWHLPSTEEWEILFSTFSSSSVGGFLKEKGAKYWDYPNTGATNKSGFRALPGGYKSSNNTFSNIGKTADFWTSSEYVISQERVYAISYGLGWKSDKISEGMTNKNLAYSVRCIKDKVESGHSDNLFDIIKDAKWGDIIKLEKKVYDLYRTLKIIGKENIIIDGNGAKLICHSPESNIISIQNSKNIIIKNIKVNHSKPATGYVGCTGNVIDIYKSSYIRIEDSEINGCGIVGVMASNTDNLKIVNNYIHDNMDYSIIYIGPSIIIKDNIFEDNGHNNALWYSFKEKGESGWPPEERIYKDHTKKGLEMKNNIFK